MQGAVVTLRVKATCRLDSVRFSPDGRFIAWVECGHAAYELVCGEAATGREVLRRRTGFHWNALAWAGPSTLAAWAARRGSRDADDERVAVASFVGADRDDDTLHCFAPEGVSLMAKGRLHQPEWIDARTVLSRGDVAGEQTVCVACAGDATPRLQTRSVGLFALGAVGPEGSVALYDATTSTFTLRARSGEARALGTRAPFDAEWASPYLSFLAAHLDGTTRVLLGSADKLPPAKRASVPGTEGDEAPPQRGVALSDALTGDTVLVHGVDAIHDRDLGGLFNPVEFHVDPSGRSLAVVVRRATSKKQHAPQHHHLIVCDLAAVVRALAPRRPAKKPRAPSA